LRLGGLGLRVTEINFTDQYLRQTGSKADVK
jgi:hypothetical protein